MVYSEYQSWRACVAGESADIDRLRTIKDKPPGLRLNQQPPRRRAVLRAHDCVAPEIEICKTLCINHNYYEAGASAGSTRSNTAIGRSAAASFRASTSSASSSPPWPNSLILDLSIG